MPGSRQRTHGKSSNLRPRSIVATFMVGAVAFASAVAGPHEISRSVVAGGGSQGLSGTDHVLSGTLGQPATRTIAGGAFLLEGGFWHGPPRAASIFADGFEGGSP